MLAKLPFLIRRNRPFARFHKQIDTLIHFESNLFVEVPNLDLTNDQVHKILSCMISSKKCILILLILLNFHVSENSCLQEARKIFGNIKLKLNYMNELNLELATSIPANGSTKRV